VPNDDYDMDKKVEISADEMCRAIVKTMEEEPFDSLIEENPLMIITFAKFGAKVTTKLFADKIKKGAAENGRSN
jgi:hypothetical protein